jgi:mRNA interferase MazF
MSLVNRGDVFDADLPDLGIRPVLIVTRQVAIPVLSGVTAALVTSTIRGIPSEVPLNSEHGLDHGSVANCDNLITIEKAALGQRRGALAFEDVNRLDDALRFALQLD